MSNATEQIFLLSPPVGQPTSGFEKAPGPAASHQINLHDVKDFSSVCRTCATVTQYVIPIFEGDGLLNKLAEKIHKHLPIQVSEKDVLPRVMCYQCASTLLAWHELVQCCVQADAALRTRLAVAPAIHASPTPRGTNSQVVASPAVEVGTAGPGASFSSKVIAAPTSAAADAASAEERLGRGTQTEPEMCAENAANQDDKREQHPAFKYENYICAQLKDILTDYFPTISVEGDTLDIEFVCQKCEERPAAYSIEQLASHILTMHSDTTKSSDIKKFVENYITLEETLSSEDSDRDIAPEPTAKNPESLPNFFCPFCESIFSSPTRLMSHLNRHIGITIEHGVECCDVTFNTKKMFVNHLQEHHVLRAPEVSANNCRTCGYAAKDLQDLQTHISRSHNDRDKTKKVKERSFKNQKWIPAVCPECNKVCSNKYNMFVHMKSHSKTATKFTCDKCDKSYGYQGNLRYHQKVAHEGVLKFACEVCGEAFPTRQARTVHARLHTGDRPYSCDYCSKSFRDKLTLERHIEMHLDIKKHMCHICPKKFRKRSHLVCHLGTHKRDT